LFGDNALKLEPNGFAFNQLFFYLGVRGDDFTPRTGNQSGGIVGVNPPGKCPKHAAERSGLKDFIMQSAPF